MSLVKGRIEAGEGGDVVTSHERSESSSGAVAPSSSGLLSRPDEAVTTRAQRVATGLAEAAGARGRDEWLTVIGDCQSLINTLTAVQDTAIAEAARRESIWCEDGTLSETVHAPGRVSLDAADVVAPVIGASHAQAQRRVEQAVRLAAGRVPVPADDRDVPEASGLGRLHEAMAAGQLDSYRAGVVAFELEVAPADVADAIVTALGDHLGDEAATLRRRTRVLLHRISPDLVRERAKRARAATGLRRWVAEPGVDEWHGTFPSEDAAAAWAAIDRLAHDLVASGTCTNIEQARGKALTDLVTGNATVDVQVVLTVPADIDSPLTTAATTTSSTSPPPAHEGSPTSAHAHSVAGAVADQAEGTAVDALNVPSATGSPSTPATTTTTDADLTAAARTHEAEAVTAAGSDGPHVAGADGAGTGGHDDDLVEVQGPRPSEPLLVRRAWLRDHLPPAPAGSSGREAKDRPRFLPCDPLTGARLDPGDHLATDAYRPAEELATLVRGRDGRCRFPGCSIAARFCDLDHVRPWPIGRTSARNLLTLCRRHHRIKQRPGWRLRLAPDGTATWTDPTGRERTTMPLNALHSLVLRADPADTTSQIAQEHATHGLSAATREKTGLTGLHEQRPATAQHLGTEPHHGTPPHVRTRPHRGTQPHVEPDAGNQQPVWSALETHLGLRLEHHPNQRTEHNRWNRPTHRRCTSAADLRAGFARRRTRVTAAEAPPF